VVLGNKCGVNTRALLTSMEAPLGRAAGNWLEVKESVECLAGKGPPDLTALVLNCAAHLLVQTRKSKSLPAAHKLASECLISGEPRRKWDEMLAAQGADLPAFRDKLRSDHSSSVIAYVMATKPGFVAAADARTIGEAIRDLGGGRMNKEASINYGVGVDRLAKPSEAVKAGSLLARIHAPNEKSARAAKDRIASAFQISKRRISPRKLIADVL
jgi:pyrimidine-nucleoside phosphorylase